MDVAYRRELNIPSDQLDNVCDFDKLYNAVLDNGSGATQLKPFAPLSRMDSVFYARDQVT